MRITNVTIEKFRSIHQMEFSATPLTAICGPNSCGKSNVLRAIKFAFLPSFSAERMADNICHDVVGGNAACQVRLSFDAPTPALAASLGIMAGQPFTYSVGVKRNGVKRAYLNGSQLSDDRRAQLLDGVLIVHVPPIRDIAAEGLRPFKETLANVLKKTRGTASFTQLNQRVRNVVRARGRTLLDGTRDVARQLLRVDELVVNTDGIDLEQLLPAAGLSVRIGGKEVGLDKLGTGHQSSVILKLYRQLGEESEKFVLYLFEEPDNHLHPTSLRAIAEDLTKCAAEDHSQVFLTTHSPYLLNQFDHHFVLPLASDSTRQTVKRAKNLTRSDREVRIALGKYGLKPAEALLADKVVVVEGPNDVTLLRTLIELQTGITPDRQDILVVSAGGKGPVGDLAGFLRELGANWRAFFDWDATESTSAPLFRDGLVAANIASLQAAATTIRAELRNLPTKASKATKIVDSMLTELANPPAAGAGFTGSILDAFLRKQSLLNAIELASLATAIGRRQPRKIAQALSTKNIWLWSGSIEEVILRSPDAENDTEAVLRQRGALHQAFPGLPERRVAMTNLLHNSAHEPDLVRDVVETLWRAGRFDKSEVKSAIQLILG